MNIDLAGYGNYLLGHLEIVVYALSPIVVYGMWELKKHKPRKNNLTNRYVKYSRQEDAINKRIKGGSIF